ncbi:hypothetical protein Fmac_018871 [Flemingia macrophylla]|uniref:Uncharacterized protein n=1 Tax=Flemingia macrophylla TaxID=520843 RepID=A0ABD1M660_9FABA
MSPAMAYGDVVLQPPSLPRAPVMEVDTSVATHSRSPFAATKSKSLKHNLQSLQQLQKIPLLWKISPWPLM